MAKTAALTLRVTQETKDKLARMAAETDRTPSAVAQRALDAYLDYHLAMVEDIERSREDFRQGRTVPHEEVMRQADEIIARQKGKGA